MFIADSQVHIWEANTPERPWAVLTYKPHRPEPFTKDHLLREMDAAGVQRAVLVPPGLEGYRNDLVLKAAQLYPDRFAVMGLFDKDAAGAREKIATWLEQPGMLGMRLSFKIVGDATDDWVWEEAEKAKMPLMLMTNPIRLHLVGRAADRHPQLKFTMDHLAIPQGVKDHEAFAHLDKLLELAKRPNIAVKVSSLPIRTTDSYPYRLLHPYLRRVYDAFGPQRMFWGTDLSRLPCTYRQAITMFTEEIPWLTAQDQEWIMGRGLCEWIGWKMPESKS